jgi:DNA-binding GntR family transcriptional regulator
MTQKQVLGKLGEVVQLKDRTYLAIKRGIIDGILEPGDALVEAELAEQMGVSKTPVREALLKLEVEGFVERVPHTGTFVCGLSLEDMLEIYVVKEELEALAVRLATPRLTPDDVAEAHALLSVEEEIWERGNATSEALEKTISFHTWITLRSGNQRLANLHHHLDDQALRLRLTLGRIPGWVDVSSQDHRSVLEAMARGDAEEASKLIRQHNVHIVAELKRLRAEGLLDLPDTNTGDDGE